MQDFLKYLLNSKKDYILGCNININKFKCEMIYNIFFDLNGIKV